MAPKTLNADSVEEYTADSMEDNEGLAHVYARPGMYIESTNKTGLHHLLWEIVNNSIDEAIAGFCTTVTVTLNPDGSATVDDDGRGIPVEDKKLKSGVSMPTVQAVFTRLGFGGKFHSKVYKYSGGLHGVGSAVVNALSDYLSVDVRRNGQVHSIGFEFKSPEEPGACVRPMEVTGKTRRKKDTGTTVTFRPLTNGRFATTTWDTELIGTRLRFFAYAVAGTKIVFTDNRNTDDPVTETYQFDNGFSDLIDERAADIGGYLTDDGEEIYDVLLDDDLAVDTPILGRTSEKGEREEIGTVEVIAQWTADRGSSVDGVVNAIPTPSGGQHVSGVQSAFVKTVNRAAREMNLLSGDVKVKWEDIAHGIVLVVNSFLANPEFSGQTKSALGGVDELDSAGLTAAFRNAVNRALSIYAEQHPVEMRDITQRAVEEMQSRIKRAEQAQTDGGGARGIAPSKNTPSKLRDCKKHGEKSEVIIVEGDSAGGGADKTRIETYQALLPLMGKMDNMLIAIVAMRRLELRMRKKEPDFVAPLPKGPVTDLVNALGAGTESRFSLAELRYGRAVIMTDADEDGRHITNLLLALFYVLMPEMIYSGRLYEVRTPLYAGHWKDEVIFVGTEAEREAYEAEQPNRNVTWERFKGLGQMNKNELFYHGLNPATRVLQQITVAEASRRAFDAIINATLGSDSQLKWDTLVSLNDADGELPEWVLAEIDNDIDDDISDTEVIEDLVSHPGVADPEDSAAPAIHA